MTKRLTAEEDEKAIREMKRCGGDGGLIEYQDRDTVIQIDKRQMEITREGERFLEVKFRRKATATDGVATPSGASGSGGSGRLPDANTEISNDAFKDLARVNDKLERLGLAFDMRAATAHHEKCTCCACYERWLTEHAPMHMHLEQWRVFVHGTRRDEGCGWLREWNTDL